MTPERWQQVKQIFNSAIQHSPQERDSFLSEACSGDERLRNEVESLIASHEKSGEFIDDPAYLAASWLADEKSELKQGQTVGTYRVLSFISRGGMGEVYLAQDQRLNRKVALKLLPESFTKDNDRLRRFAQEARAASALNHPNIITIYEIQELDSTHVIATEFVEGETLRERLSRSALALSETLNIAIQVADAISAAHKAGIIHRDIKPENVMIRPDGYVKVLDFGLAKLIEQTSPVSSSAGEPSRQMATGSGVILGTVGYMSPEQARAQTIDARSDIFSLGAVLYEMVAGRKPFDGESATDVLAAILKTEPPPVSQYTPDAPPELVRILNKALKKDREERYQVVRDLLLDLKSLLKDLEFQQRLETSSSEGSSRTPSANIAQPTGQQGVIKPTDEISMFRGRRWSVFALLALIATIGGSLALYKLFGRSSNTAVVAPPTAANIERITAWAGLDTQPSLSPDGNSFAYSSNHNGTFEIYVRQLTSAGRELQLTSDGQENFQPAWSPDGQRVAYYSKKRGGIWVVSALGGEDRQLTDFGSGPAWSADGSMIVFQSDSDPDLGSVSVGSSTIWTVPSQGGTPRQVTKIGSPKGGHMHPTWSSSSRRIAFVNFNFNDPDQQIWSVAVDGNDLKKMTSALHVRVGYPVFSPDDRNLYFVSGATIASLPVSPESGEPIGEPLKLTDAVDSNITNLAISADGKRMVYSAQTFASNIWSVPISPKTNEVSGVPQSLTNQSGVRNNLPTFSPDGRRIAFSHFLRGGAQTIWLMDVDGKNPVQVTTNFVSFLPSWFPDGDQIAFISNRDNRRSVWATSVQSKREYLLFDIGKNMEYARLSSDGKQLAFNLSDRGVTNVWIVSVSSGQLKQLTFDKELAGFGCWSPDGMSIAYQVKRGDDVYVMIVPSEGGESIQLTPDHGRSWPYDFSPDGDKISFAGERGGVWNVWWVSRSTKQQKQLTNYARLNAFVRYPAWSPLGNQIAYEYNEITGNIWTLELK